MKFFMQDDTSKEVDKIMAQLKSYMDGGIAQQMRDKGLDYKLNFGVSMFWLRKIAANHKNKQALAERLWLREARETMIIASMIADSNTFSSVELEQWFDKVKTNELAEQFGVNLLSRLDNSAAVSSKYISSSNIYKKAAGWAALSIIMKDSSLDNADLLIEEAFNNIVNDSIFLQRTKGRFLRAACRKSTSLLEIVEGEIAKIKTEHKVAYLVQEIESEIDFVKNIK